MHCPGRKVASLAFIQRHTYTRTHTCEPGSSRHDVSLFSALEDVEHILPHLARLLAGVNALPDTGFTVVLDDGGSLLVVGAKTLLEGVSIVIASLD